MSPRPTTIKHRRPDLDNVISSLTQLGANHVFTYDALTDKALLKQVKQWTSKSVGRYIFPFESTFGLPLPTHSQYDLCSTV